MVIFVFVIMAAVTSLFAVAVLIGEAKGLSKGIVTGNLLLAGGTVISSWVLVHTVFTVLLITAKWMMTRTARKGQELNSPVKSNRIFSTSLTSPS